MRHKGRKNDGLREIKIELGFLKYAQGSCLFTIGNTKVLCGANLEEGVPPFLKGTGEGWLTAEYSLLPYSTPTRTPRERGGGRTQEIQRIIGRSLRAVVELQKIGERTIWIDCDVLQADGGTRCAAVCGAFLALKKLEEYLRKRGSLIGSLVREWVGAVSVGVVKGEKLLDLSYQEDVQAEVDLNVVMTEKGELVEVQGTGEKKPFSRKDFLELLELAEKGIREIIRVEREVLKNG